MPGGKSAPGRGHRCGAARPRALRTGWLGGAATAAVTTTLLVVLAGRQQVDYDGFWHVFVARQESWGPFVREVIQNAHPPLYYLVLKGAVLLFGNSALVYRVPALLAVAVATVLLTRTAVTVTRNPPLAVVAGVAFGLSASLVQTALAVRAYALFVAALVAATWAYVEWLAARPGRATARARPLFAAALSAALLSHYSAFFFLGAAVIAPGILVLLHARWRVRLRRELAGHRLALLAMFGLPLAVAAGVMAVHLRLWGLGSRLNHVPQFMYDARLESASAFLLRTTGSLAQLFLPDLGIERRVMAVAAVLLVGAFLWLVSLRPVRGRVLAVPIVLFALMLAANVVAGLTHRYPYGGYLRHEVFLFPFAVLGLFAALECARRAAPFPWSSNRRWVAGIGTAVAASVALWLSTLQVGTQLPGAVEMSRFRSVLGKPPLVLVDQYNFIVMFGHLHEWRWHLRWEARSPRVWQARRQRMWQVWDVSRNGERVQVCRHALWQLNFSAPDFYADVAECLRTAGADHVAVYRPQQGGFTPAWKIEETAALVRELGPRGGVSAAALFVEGDDVYASFRALPTKAEEQFGLRTLGTNRQHEVGDEPAERVGIDGLLEVVAEALSEGSLTVPSLPVGRDGHGGNVSAPAAGEGAHVPDQPVPVAIRHGEIAHDRVRPELQRFERFERFATGGRRRDVGTGRFQDRPEHLSTLSVVVHQEHVYAVKRAQQSGVCGVHGTRTYPPRPAASTSAIARS